MSDNNNLPSSKEEIKTILNRIKNCVKLGKYSVENNINRQENTDFLLAYNIDTRKEREILLNITVEDFSEALRNIKPRYSHEILYLFAPWVSLDTLEGGRGIDLFICEV